MRCIIGAFVIWWLFVCWFTFCHIKDKYPAYASSFGQAEKAKEKVELIPQELNNFQKRYSYNSFLIFPCSANIFPSYKTSYVMIFEFLLE